MKLKEWAFDPSIQQRLVEETKSYLQTYTPFGAGGETISRDQTDTLLDEILNSNNIELVLLTGVAGSGKSGIVRCVIKKLGEHNVPHLAFRIDQFLSCSTKEELGKKLTGREESPVSTLKGSFPTIPSVLFIDQVDAVSEVSGRDGQVKEVLFRIITDAHNFGGVKVVVVCRSFDLESDYRLKSLKEDNRTKTIEVPLLDWIKDVEPLLKNKGVDVFSLIEPQRQLLRLPINLAIFMEIDDLKFPFHSVSNLYEKLIDKKQRTISNERKITWSRMLSCIKSLQQNFYNLQHLQIMAIPYCTCWKMQPVTYLTLLLKQLNRLSLILRKMVFSTCNAVLMCINSKNF